MPKPVAPNGETSPSLSLAYGCTQCRMSLSCAQSDPIKSFPNSVIDVYTSCDPGSIPHPRGDETSYDNVSDRVLLEDFR